MKMKDSGVAWIGKIPAVWETRNLTHCCRFFKGLAITKADLTETGTAVISYGQIHSKLNVGTHLKPELLRCVPEAIANADPGSRLKVGDIVFADTSEDVEGCGNCVLMDADIPVYAGYHAIVARPEEPSRSRYFSYLFNAPCWRSQVRSKVAGIKVFSITQRIFKGVSVLLPSESDANAIVAYLDEKTAAIDARVAVLEKKLAAYRRLKTSVINQAVTRGLDPKTKLKDSGVDWIGKIPAGWEVGRVKDAAIIGNGSDPKTDGDIPVYGSGEGAFKTCGEFKEGPVVLIGRKGALHIPHYVEGRYWNVDTAFDVRVSGENSLRWFYYQALRFEYRYYMSQTTLPSMTQSDYQNMVIGIPSPTEQRAIADYLDAECAKIDKMAELVTREIELYKKLKRSLINEIVTGKRAVAGEGLGDGERDDRDHRDERDESHEALATHCRAVRGAKAPKRRVPDVPEVSGVPCSGRSGNCPVKGVRDE